MMKRLIGWRLNTLLTGKERDYLEGLMTLAPEDAKTTVQIRGLRDLARKERRVLFGKASGGTVEYKNYAGNEDSIPSERLLWNFFPGTLDERGGMRPTVVDVWWTMDLMILLVKVGSVRSLLVSDENAETEIHVQARMRTIEEALNDGSYIGPVKKVLEPITNELTTALMMKR